MHYIPYAHGLQQELLGRFNEHFKIAAQIQLVLRNVASTRFADIEQAVKFYYGDTDCEAMGDEFARCKKWQRIPERERPGSAIDTGAAIETQKKKKKTFIQIFTHYWQFWLLFLLKLLLQKESSAVCGA